MCFGSFLQTEGNVPAIDTRATVEAVRFVADLWKSGQDARVFSWNPASNNQFLLSGEGSLVMNAISAVRTAENLELPFANDLWIWPVPAGPRARLALGQYTSVYSIWKFAKSPDIARRFLADLCVDARQATVASGLFSFPSFPGAYRRPISTRLAAADPHEPKGKYSILTTVALEHTRNAGYPGTANAAVMEALDAQPRPVHVRPRLARQGERRGLGRHDGVGAEADLAQMESGRKGLRSAGPQTGDQAGQRRPHGDGGEGRFSQIVNAGRGVIPALS